MRSRGGHVASVYRLDRGPGNSIDTTKNRHGKPTITLLRRTRSVVFGKDYETQTWDIHALLALWVTRLAERSGMG